MQHACTYVRTRDVRTTCMYVRLTDPGPCAPARPYGKRSVTKLKRTYVRFKRTCVLLKRTCVRVRAFIPVPRTHTYLRTYVGPGTRTYVLCSV